MPGKELDRGGSGNEGPVRGRSGIRRRHCGHLQAAGCFRRASNVGELEEKRVREELEKS